MKDQNMAEHLLEELLERIGQANEGQLQAIMDAVRDRYAIAFPDWEVIWAAVHKDPRIREIEIKRILEVLRQDL